MTEIETNLETHAEHVIDWKKIKQILNDVLIPLQTVCTLLPPGLPKTICCGIVAGLQALIAMLPNE